MGAHCFPHALDMPPRACSTPPPSPPPSALWQTNTYRKEWSRTSLYVVTSRSSTFWQTLRLNDRRPLSLLRMPTTDDMVDNEGKRTRTRESNRERKGERHAARTAKRKREGSRLEEKSPEKGERGERYPQNKQYYNTGLLNMKQHDTGHLHTPYTLFWSSVAPTEHICCNHFEILCQYSREYKDAALDWQHALLRATLALEYK